MKKNFRVDLSQDELAALILALHQSKDNEKLTDRLAGKYVTQAAPKSTLTKGASKLAADAVRDGRLMRVIVHALSILTGYPEDQIRPTTSLSSIGLTPAKREQLRIHVNRYIHERGYNKFISASEMAATNTVDDIHTLAVKKMS